MMGDKNLRHLDGTLTFGDYQQLAYGEIGVLLSLDKGNPSLSITVDMNEDASELYDNNDPDWEYHLSNILWDIAVLAKLHDIPLEGLARLSLLDSEREDYSELSEEYSQDEG